MTTLRVGRLCVLGLMVALGGMVLAPVASAAPEGAVFSGAADQVVTVHVPSAGAVAGTLTAWERGADGAWQVFAGPVAADVGAEGIGAADEFSTRTPAGVFPLTQAFGRQSAPATAMPYFQSDRRDWWDSNPLSPTYNTHVRQDASPGGNSENLYEAGPLYDYAVAIGHNAARIPGAGSAMFLHVTDGTTTEGCVATDRDTLVALLGRLDPAKRPVIEIAVGA
ncbi:L,D-transpeptidase family protein [Rhodococcus jostii]|uniref:L,D-peptidoglycan transpeptidase YkuD, ErfK/YbiS/YcfS/YnhG family n=1 Tax=Rhodococcus jostii TaxID=132919 RepID=A0A1H5IM31_RHOJO|nr:L,D-transpeptidase family protein [Rhodococcus jostii]SEE41114.1 L,D-peptidoglycan transpeptidase YkuD, ErfK/YbiS/YcfS/YnhG family [Rhodococcus jostii]